MPEYWFESEDLNEQMRCGICGEFIHTDQEIGEYVGLNDVHVIAHEDCARAYGYEMA